MIVSPGRTTPPGVAAKTRMILPATGAFTSRRARSVGGSRDLLVKVREFGFGVAQIRDRLLDALRLGVDETLLHFGDILLGTRDLGEVFPALAA